MTARGDLVWRMRHRTTGEVCPAGHAPIPISDVVADEEVAKYGGVGAYDPKYPCRCPSGEGRWHLEPAAGIEWPPGWDVEPMPTPAE